MADKIHKQFGYETEAEFLKRYPESRKSKGKRKRRAKRTNEKTKKKSTTRT